LYLQILVVQNSHWKTKNALQLCSNTLQKLCAFAQTLIYGRLRKYLLSGETKKIINVPKPNLTKAEMKVVKLLVEGGLSNKKIAKKLSIDEKNSASFWHKMCFHI